MNGEFGVSDSAICVEKGLAAIIEALDAGGEHSAPGSTEHRGETRRLLRAKCELWTCNDEDRVKVGQDTVTRNFSFSGLSVVARLTQPLLAGRPIEAVITMPNFSRRHVAGTVVFCRLLPDECYEIGIHARAVGAGWIVAGDVEASKRVYDWFAEALNTPE